MPNLPSFGWAVAKLPREQMDARREVHCRGRPVAEARTARQEAGYGKQDITLALVSRRRGLTRALCPRQAQRHSSPQDRHWSLPVRQLSPVELSYSWGHAVARCDP